MILLALFLTAFIYLIFPICYRASKGKVCKKQGKKIALINSIICFLVFAIITACTDGDVSRSGAPAFLYYFIAKSILIDKNLPNEKKDFIRDNLNVNKNDNVNKKGYNEDYGEYIAPVENYIKEEKENNSMEKITRSMSLEYGTNSRKIYVSLCQKFNWDINRQSDFGRQGVRLYAENSTPEGCSVWFLGHNNWTDTKSSAWKNEILGDLVIETWEIIEYGLYEDDSNRVIFAKNGKKGYVFLGVYGVVDVKEAEDSDGKRIWKKTYKRISDTYPV